MLKLQLNGLEPKVFSEKEIETIKNELDVLAVDHNNFSVLKNNKSYTISILSIDHDTKTIQLSIDNIVTSLKISNKTDLLLEKLGIDPSKSQKLTILKAPMPGLVIDWAIKVGDSVKTGDKLLILEAMKMENVIKASGDGIIKKIHVEKGVAVEKNQLLIDFA